MKWLMLMLVLTVLTFPPQADGWTPPVEVRKGKLKAASYRARLAGDVLLIEVSHEPGWHTYALDNEARAKKRTGAPPLGIENDTEIEVSGGLAVVGKWRQSAPKDLSQREINWFTWGFEGVSLFAVKVKRTGGAESVITINAQACKATLCAMVDDLEIRLPLDSAGANPAGFDLLQLVEEGDLSNLNE
jgi:DsbC/DsbD-like thiol-disulfide interchange protein